MSKLVLARTWRKMPKEQRAEFVREFKEHLSRTYGNAPRSLRSGARGRDRHAGRAAQRRLGHHDDRRGQFDGSVISYRLRNRNDRWRIIDVVIEGGSLVSNYRSNSPKC